MPVKSKAQARFMGAVAAGKVPGVKKSVGKEFIAATPTTKGLPNKVGKTNSSRKTKNTIK